MTLTLWALGYFALSAAVTGVLCATLHKRTPEEEMADRDAEQKYWAEWRKRRELDRNTHHIGDRLVRCPADNQ